MTDADDGHESLCLVSPQFCVLVRLYLDDRVSKSSIALENTKKQKLPIAGPSPQVSSISLDKQGLDSMPFY